jgi:L-ascorbate metabolism protein UlaG (beta-lactamase superfamily)
VVHEAPVRDAEGLHVTWLGHSSALVEIEGHRVLLDPVWSERCSPSRLAGPKRMHEPPVALRDLPALDAVVISHDHYDHLDMATIQHLADLQAAPFLVPLGVGAHLERWGVPATRIIELDWEERADVAGLQIVCTAARHFSGRGFSRDETLWSSWVIAGPTRRAFYSGDSGYFPGFADIGAEHGPFDVALVQVGAYGEAWPDIHMLPEDGVAAHVDVGGGLLVPVHWCTFNLALHDWSEPADRTWREAKARDVALAIPCPGERVDVDDPPSVDGWWQTIA